MAAHNTMPGPQEAALPRVPPAAPQSPRPQANGPPVEAKNGRPVRYPIRLRVNINEVMAESLQRVCQRLGIPEGIGARIAISQFLLSQDPHYSHDVSGQ